MRARPRSSRLSYEPDPLRLSRVSSFVSSRELRPFESVLRVTLSVVASSEPGAPSAPPLRPPRERAWPPASPACGPCRAGSVSIVLKPFSARIAGLRSCALRMSRSLRATRATSASSSEYA